MAMMIRSKTHAVPCAPRAPVAVCSIVAGTLLACLLPAAAAASDHGPRGGGEQAYCSSTAKALFRACGYEIQDDYWVAVAVCTNVSDDAARAACLAGARDSRSESENLCGEQRAARLRVCKSQGEGRYDPDFDPALFDDPTNPSNPNKFFPLKVGNKWEFGGDECITIEVLNATKLIEGVTCIVIRDVVTVDGEVIEDTDDWFAQAKEGDVWYCGEEVKDYESFDGDDPMTPELVSIDGSFKVGRDGDKPGIIFRAAPKRGETYREEFSLGNAEDVAVILSNSYAFGEDPELDRLVPQELAELLCSGDCVVTRNFALTEPGVFARKYYAPGIGGFLEVGPTTGEVVQLVGCNFDPRCAHLPTPGTRLQQGGAGLALLNE
jgi:hypothetical protein